MASAKGRIGFFVRLRSKRLVDVNLLSTIERWRTVVGEHCYNDPLSI